MNIGLIAVDSNYPNLALMKISQFHKKNGNNVEWYNPFNHYDIVYMSKIFSFTPDFGYFVNAKTILKGGTGYSLNNDLPNYIDRLQPDYSIYPDIPEDTGYGFLTRGCPNKCKWCVVPQKEGPVHKYMDIDDIAKEKKKVILMDNNILSIDYGIEQLIKISNMDIRVDFNQGLDARLVNEYNAKILANIKWIRYIRFGCDTPKQVEECINASNLLFRNGYNRKIFLYCLLIGDINECYDRVNRFRNDERFVPFAQPYRDINLHKTEIPMWQKDMAHWVNRKEYFRSCEFKDFMPRKGFKCISYFDDNFIMEDKRQLHIFD